MSSQEEYLDNLLKGIGNQTDEEVIELDRLIEEEAEIGSVLGAINIDEEVSTVDDVDTIINELSDADEFDLNSMLENLGEDDIEKILTENQSVTPDLEEQFDDVDLMTLLDGAADEDSQDIQEMLQRDEQKELLDEVTIPDLQDVVAGLNLDGDDTEELSGGAILGLELDDKVNTAEEKRRLRQEQKEEKRKLREAKKAERKAAKEALKEQKRREKEEKAALKKQEQEVNLQEQESKTQEQEPELFQMESGELSGVTNEDDLFMESLFGGNLNEIGNLANLEDLTELHAMEPEDTLEIANEMDLFLDSATDDGLAMVDLASEVDSLEEIQEKSEKKEKKGFFSKILDLLTEEDGEEEPENENIRLSEENQEILKEMDKEKGKKSKKAKKSKKKGKSAENSGDTVSENGSEIPEKKNQKDQKPKKEKKPKKKKEEKLEEVLDEKPGKKLSLKKILPIAVMCLTITIAIILVSNLVNDYSVKKAGRQAYYEGDYQTCYQNLYGKDLNESEQVMYGKSESILRIRLWMKEYELFANEGDRVRALDSLIQSVNDYPKLYEYAAEWNASGEVSEVYQQMLTILSNEFGLSEADALSIAAEPDDVDYTIVVTSIADGGKYGADSTNESTPKEELPLQDVLPEEEGLNSSNFIDNSK